MCDDCGNNDGSVSLHLMCQACKDNVLFKQPPLGEDCPICFLTLPSLMTGRKYKTCCGGKIICSGCIHAVNKMKGDRKCPFCRVPSPKLDEERVEGNKKRVEMNDAEGIRNLGWCYFEGIHGMTQDRAKALEFWHRAGELGNASAYYNIGCAYDSGNGAERDLNKAKHFYELAALGGDAMARYNLGWLEEETGNMVTALKHYIISAECGDDLSLKRIKEFYVNGHATKDDYAKALRTHQTYIVGIKSAQRDEAAAFDSEHYRYY